MNIFNDKPSCFKGSEAFLELAKFNNARITLIRSHEFKEGVWYDQAEYEWVVLLQGHATIAFETTSISLQSGDTLTITPHCKHQVVSTSKDALWLAVHINS